MKMTWVTRFLFAAGFVVLAAVNYTVLSRVAENRKGDADAHLWLTERELPKSSHVEKENSGLELQLTWRTLSKEENEVYNRTPAWLRGEKLEKLGFRFVDGAPSDKRRDRRAVSREVCIVLEYNGPAYQEALKRAERSLEKEEEALRANPADKGLQAARQQAEKRVRSEAVTQSRLFAVDAGTDPRQLRTRYADSSRYIVARGVVRLMYRNEGDREWAAGYIESISTAGIHVPLEHRLVLDKILQEHTPPSSEGKPPRYEVELIYGSRLEPWVTSIRPLDAQQEQR
jgi:hypothetical protein